MIITRRGKCDTCQTPCSEKRDFPETTDMFNPTKENTIQANITPDVIAWRDKPIYCKEHK